MKLAEILKEIPVLKTLGGIDLEITGIRQDSRLVKPGDLFLCVRGVKADGHQFLNQAVSNGAVAALVEYIPEDHPDIPLILVEEVAANLRGIAGAFYDYPDRKLNLIGVVGTNGKTTSTYLMKNILETAGYKVGLIGTIANYIGDRAMEAHNTTPGALELQELFAEMVKAGVEYVVMEVSSHSIHQGRVAGLAFKAGIFTNITQDHLDYHKTFAEYLNVKTKFFSELPITSTAIINADDSRAAYILSKISARAMTYGIYQKADVTAQTIKLNHSGVSFRVLTPADEMDLELNLTGYFNVYNSLAVFTAALSLGINIELIKTGLEKITGVPGRFQLVSSPDVGFGVIVDYAHTPDGLENILKTGRGLNPQRLIVVFGCGGDRDRTKRPLMGALAAELADYSIITSDNPRTEEPEEIVREIETGFKTTKAEASYELEIDRAKAIKKAINLAQTGDLILIAGKGHETYQIFKDRAIHFDDREVARQALEEKLHGKV